MIQITDKQNCCGCEACVQACPKRCITMKRDAEGFLYPVAEASVCVECGLCEKVCPVLNQYERHEPMQMLAAINKDEAVRVKSSSGGVFTLLAEETIDKGGVVFGARFDDDWQVVMDAAETMEQIAIFRGSKYVQARVGDSYAKCKKYLEAGREVMFTGTPCQIAGLQHFLRKPYENLTTVDFICHGVPSPGVWKRYLDEVVTAGKQAIKDVNFRNKSKGWKRFSFAIDYRGDSDTISLVSPLDKNPFMRVFLNDMILRPSCHNCPAKAGKSLSDMTIADFWGVQNIVPSIDDDKGTSLVLVNTEIGERAIPFERLSHIATDINALRYNSAYFNSAKPNPRREEFFAAYSNGKDGLHRIIAHSLRLTPKQKAKRLLRYPIMQVRKLVSMLLHKEVKKTTGEGKLCVNAQYTVPSSNLKTCGINFRDKRNGWKHYMLRIDFKDTK